MRTRSMVVALMAVGMLMGSASAALATIGSLSNSVVCCDGGGRFGSVSNSVIAGGGGSAGSVSNSVICCD